METEVIKNEEAGETNRELVHRLAITDTSNQQDSFNLGVILRRLGFPNAIVISGIVYLEGHGTLDCPPTDIHSIARAIQVSLEKIEAD